MAYHDTYIANERRTIIVGRICSCCGSPVLSRIVVHSMAVTSAYTEAIQLADAAVKKDVAETVHEIEISKRDHVAITRRLCSENEKLGKKTFMQLQGINDICPNCFSAEPWMPERLSSKKMEELSDENYPRIFATDAEARNWALGQVAARVQHIQRQRQSPNAIADARNEIQSINTAMQELDDARLGLDLQEQKVALVKQREALKAQKYDIGLLDFGGRWELRKALNLVEYRINKLEEKYAEINKSASEKQLQLQVALQKAWMIAAGCTDRVLLCRAGNSRSFHPEIPGVQIQVFPWAQLDDLREEQTGTERWEGEGEPLKPGCWPHMKSLLLSPEAVRLLHIFTFIFQMGYIDEIVRLFRRGQNDWLILTSSIAVLLSVLEYLYFARTKENRKKYAGMFFLILVSCMLLVVSITGMVFAARSGAQPRLVLFSAITAVILTAAVLIGLRLRGVKLSKLRLFTKKK